MTLKTVEWHLKHTYGKLGISSRAELAQALTRPLPPPGDPDMSRRRDPRGRFGAARPGQNTRTMRGDTEETQDPSRFRRYTPEVRTSLAPSSMRRSLTLALDDFGQATLQVEAGRLSVTTAELVGQATVYYLEDRPLGRPHSAFPASLARLRPRRSSSSWSWTPTRGTRSTLRPSASASPLSGSWSTPLCTSWRTWTRAAWPCASPRMSTAGARPRRTLIPAGLSEERSLIVDQASTAAMQ